MLARAGIVTIIVSNIILIYFDLEMNLNILVIRNARTNVVDAPRVKGVENDRILETREMMTIDMSNLFPLSIKYILGPNAINLNIASSMNMTAKP